MLAANFAIAVMKTSIESVLGEFFSCRNTSLTYAMHLVHLQAGSISQKQSGCI